MVILMSVNRDSPESQEVGGKGRNQLMMAGNKALGLFFTGNKSGFPEHMLNSFTQNPKSHLICSELDIRLEKTLIDVRYSLCERQ